MLQNLLEKLQLKEEKNILIQGLPSSIEKQFLKITFAKNLTPLLKIRKVDFALIFAINENQLRSILNEVLPALHDETKFWVAYPKAASKISTDLNRNRSWNFLCGRGYEEEMEVPLDHVWSAIRFKRTDEIPELVEVEEMYEEAVRKLPSTSLRSSAPSDFVKHLNKNKSAAHFFETLSNNDKKEYLNWIGGARRQDTRSRRMDVAIDKLIAGKKNPTQK